MYDIVERIFVAAVVILGVLMVFLPLETLRKYKLVSKTRGTNASIKGLGIFLAIGGAFVFFTL